MTRWLRRRWLPVAVLAVMLALSFWPKTWCLEQLEAGVHERHWCYSDIKELWDIRGFDVEAAPYADPPPGYRAYTFEYPPGLGFPAYGLARLADTPLGYFAVTAVTLALAAFVTLALLDILRRTLALPPDRLLIFAAAPTLLFFAFHNWDLWAVAPAVAGLAAATRRHPILAGALFGLAAAVKWWPAVLVIVVVFGPWARSAGAAAAGPALARRSLPALVAASTWTLVQLPALAASPANWWAATAFHLERPPNRDSLLGVADAWMRAAGLSSVGLVNAADVVTLALLVASVAWIAWRLERRLLAPQDAALALVIVFMLTSKVFSPQFLVWLVPLAAVASVRWRHVLAAEAANIAVWILLAHGLRPLGVYQPFVLVRHVALVWLLVAVLRNLPYVEKAPVARAV